MKNWIAEKVANLLPRRVVYYCLVRAFVHATTGEWGDTIASELTLFDAASRWEEPRREKTPQTPEAAGPPVATTGKTIEGRHMA